MSRWTDRELNILKTYYPIGGVKLVKEKGIVRSDEAIRMRASKEGCSLKQNVLDGFRGKWSKDELSILKKHYPNEGLDVVLRLKGRSERAIQVKASQLGLKLHSDLKEELTNRWSESEIELLYNYYEDCGAKYIKEKGVYRSVYAIVSKANKLGLRRGENI